MEEDRTNAYTDLEAAQLELLAVFTTLSKSLQTTLTKRKLSMDLKSEYSSELHIDFSLLSGYAVSLHANEVLVRIMILTSVNIAQFQNGFFLKLWHNFISPETQNHITLSTMLSDIQVIFETVA